MDVVDGAHYVAERPRVVTFGRKYARQFLQCLIFANREIQVMGRGHGIVVFRLVNAAETFETAGAGEREYAQVNSATLRGLKRVEIGQASLVVIPPQVLCGGIEPIVCRAGF